MHAVHFWGQERGLPEGGECPTCDRKREYAKGKVNLSIVHFQDNIVWQLFKKINPKIIIYGFDKSTPFQWRDFPGALLVANW